VQAFSLSGNPDFSSCLPGFRPQASAPIPNDEKTRSPFGKFSPAQTDTPKLWLLLHSLSHWGIRFQTPHFQVMSTQRQQKFSRLLQKELGELFQHDTKSMFGGAFITVSGVQVSPDFSIATVYLSLTLSKKPQVVLEDIREKSKVIRQQLASRIRNQVRIIPELRFFADETLLEAEKMDKLLASLNIPPAP
jgi:ribosome-binding factor A